MRYRLLISGVLFFAWPSGAGAVIGLDANFDHGSLKSYTLTNPTTPTPTVNLVGRDNFYGGGKWRWMNFRVDNALSVRPTFRVSDNFAPDPSLLDGHAMVFSYDRVNWNYFPTNSRSGGFYSFSNTTSFTGNTVYVAYAFPYSYGDSVAHTQTVLASPWARPTASGNAAGVIGQSPGGTDDLGRVVAPRNIYAYRITNPATDSATIAKKKIVISTGLHAGETLGTHTYQGLVDWLISDDPRAVALRGTTEVFCYPTMNPDGRFAGNNRATVNNPNQDPNGLWNPTLWMNRQDIRKNGEAMIADRAATPGANVDVFIDFHSTVPTGGDDFGFIEYEQGDNLAPFWVKLKQLQPNIQDTDSTGTSWTSANFAEAFLGAQVDVTFETQFGTRRPLSHYTETGRNFGRAFQFAFGPKPGDANYDRTVNFNDLLVLAQNFNRTSGATWAQADFDFDGDVDFADLLALAQRYGQAGVGEDGATTLAELPADFAADWIAARLMVPEPAAGVAIGAAGLVGLVRRRR